MKKSFIFTLMFLFCFPLLTTAQSTSTLTVQQQYESALRQVIILLQQQVEVLIQQLNALQTQTVKIDPTYTYTPITTTPVVVPDLPTPIVVGTTQPTATAIATTTPTLTPEWTPIQISENVAEYILDNKTDSNLTYTSATLEIYPITIVNEHQSVVVTGFLGNPISIPSIYSKPISTTIINLPIDLFMYANKNGQLRFEVNAYNVGNANDRYSIRLISLQ